MNETALLDRLRADPDHAGWYATLSAAENPSSIDWPDETAFAAFLEYAEIPDDERPTLRDLYPVAAADPDLRWIVECYVALLSARIGVPGYEELPPLPAEIGETRDHLFTIVHAVHLPRTLGWHRSHDVPDTISQATMADIGRHYRIERAEHGRSALSNGHGWLTLHARGLIYQLGRLQFEIAPLGGRTSETIRAAGLPAERGEPSLSVHIPSFMGAMSQEACDDSFAQARSFFATHIPELPVRYASCHSWLLDPQLAGYLPADSNIIRFQRRFRPAREGDPGNEDTLNFVFRSPGTPLEALPQRTTLERAVVRHIREGGQWLIGHGWLEL